MSRKPIVPMFAGAGSGPAVPLFAGGEKKQEKLPLALPRLSIGTEWHLAVAGVLLALVFVTYGNSFQSEWVLDNKYIIELDPRTKAVAWDDVGIKPGVRNIWTQDYWWPKGISGLYRPLTSFTYWMNWTFFKNGYNPTAREQVVGFHWVNLAIHYLNAFLFYRLMLRLTKRFWVSFFAAAVFVTHPIATESVTNIIGRADMFAATTVLGCMLLWIDVNRHRENSTSAAKESSASPTGEQPTAPAAQGWLSPSTKNLLQRIGWLTALMTLTILGMFCKESWIAVGVVIVIYDLIYRLGERWQKFWLREFILALARWLMILPLFYFAFNTYLKCIVPWLEQMTTGSAGYVWTIIGAFAGLFAMLFSMVLLTTRKLLAYGIAMAAGMLLLCGLGIGHGDVKWPVIGLALSTLIFLGIEFGFGLVWPEDEERVIDPDKPRLWKGFFDGYFVLLPVVVLMYCTRQWVFGNTTPAEEPFLDNPLRGLGFVGSRMTAAKVWAMLLWKLIWPVHLSSDYSYNQIPLFGYHDVTMWQNIQCVFAMLLFIAIGVGAIYCWWKGQRGIAFFIMLYYVNYLPTSNLPYIIGSIMAERFMYLPLIGFSAVVVIAVDLVARKIVGALDDPETIVGSVSTRPDEASRGGLEASPVLEYARTGLGQRARSWLADYPFLRHAPHVALCLLVMVYGVRAFYRNYAWHTDVTLWEAAKAESPLSFRSYQSYAFALFEQDAAGNCDRMIATDETGLKLVDDLPNPLNSSRLYLHLGMYYDLKGQLLSQGAQGGKLPPEAIPWFQKSAGILERGVPIDRAFNEVNRGRDVKRGRNGADTPDVGLAPVYSYLGIAYMRLGLLDQAERTFKYMRHLEPREQSGDVYIKLALVQDARGKYEEEAVSLMQAILLDSTRQEAWAALNEVFKKINTEPYPCIVMNAEGRAQLDLSRKAVRETVLQAYRDFVRIFIQAKQPKYAESAADVAVKTYGFDRATYFDPLFDPKYLANFPKPAPADPVFYKPPPVRFDIMMPEVQQAFLEETGGTRPEKVNEEIVEGRAVYTFDINGKHIRISEEGKVLGSYGHTPREEKK